MSYDIYGEPLRRGHCEVHPHIHEEYPCSVCIQESNNRNSQQQSECDHHNIASLEHGLELSQQRIAELEQRIAELVDALNHIARVANSSRTQSRRDRWICLRANCAISSSDEWKTANLPKIIENSRGRELRLRAENQELSATVERLRGVVVNYHDENIAAEEAMNELWDIHNATPHQNLNAIKREIAKEAILAAIEDYKREYCGQGIEALLSSFSDIYPSQRYPDKDGE